MTSYETSQEKGFREFSLNYIPILHDELRTAREEIMTLRNWIRETGPRTFEGHSSGVTSVCQVSNTTFLSASNDRTIKLMDITTGECLKTFGGHSNKVNFVCQMSDTTFLSGSDDNTIKLWDITTGECVKIFEGHSLGVNSICQVSDTTFLSGSDDYTIKLWLI